MNTFSSYQTQVLDEWNKFGMYKLYDINKRPDSQTFRFIDGPPFCSGKLHAAHCAIGTIKSTILNYKSMTGFKCDNKLGYDCHGVPIESVTNRELSIKTLADLEQVGIVKFNQFCKDTIKQCERDWEPVYNSIGRWANFNNVYKTIDRNFMESVWWGFSTLFNKGLIYRGYKITPYSYALQSPLSNFEASEGQKEVDCRSIYVKFQINTFSPHLPDTILEKLTNKTCYLVAWTTTPWTLPANLALCVNNDLEYDFVVTETNNDTPEIFILGKDTAKNASIKVTQHLGTVKGHQLIGTKYQPMFNTYAFIYDNPDFNSIELEFNLCKWFTVLADNYVKESGNTGSNIVHLAPVFGEDDYRVCKEQSLVIDAIIKDLEIIDKDCNYMVHARNVSSNSYTSPSDLEKYKGQLVFDAETPIIKHLKEIKSFVKTQQIRHTYPHCYRTDTPLVYRTCESFYVNVQAIKQRMIELNRQTTWYPESIGTQRFHNWLTDAKDWCISRSRYFGTPIPAWICETDGSMLVISSIEQLEKLTHKKFADIHPEYLLDAIITDPETGKTYKRVSDVFDCWFESGSVPFAQHHYPFENKILLDKILEEHSSFSDFIVEGIDQTRGWFYTLLILSTALFDVAPAKNIMAVGHILDEHGKKMSKKLKNYVDPTILIENYGADSIRLYMLQSSITTGIPLAFKEDDIKIVNKTLFQFKNCVDFLVEHVTNQKHHGVTFNHLAYQQTTNSMDKWIMLHVNNTIQQIVKEMNNFQIARSARQVIDMIEDITNWYLKFNRDRLKGKLGDKHNNKHNNSEWVISTSVLYQVIKRYIIVMAPFAPFISQWIYSQLDTIHENNYQFVHMESYDTTIDISMVIPDDTEKCYYLDTFELLKRVSKLVRTARMRSTTHNSNKTPIKSCVICMDSPKQLEQIAQCIDLIQSELNVIDMKYEPLTGNLKYRYVPNRAQLGKKYKKDANTIYKLLEKYIPDTDTNTNTITLVSDTMVEYVLEDGDYVKEPVFTDNDIYYNDVQTGVNILVTIDFTYDSEIENMFHLKRLISQIQQDRKHMGLKPWNKISIEFTLDDFKIVSSNVEYIKSRLECDINTHSKVQPNLEYSIDDDTDTRKIFYSIRLL
jgi:isoleucyl-tRNA synthetase